MGLEEYRRKRDFRKTSEPAPRRERAKEEGHSYLVQKHAATRLHYDFRLELDGVLLSWAVTRGPSLNPADKRLAVRTEDHPLSYGDFEGTIPKGQYGGGTVMLWDKGTWEPKGDPKAELKKGHLAFTLHGERLKGDWDLIRMRGDGKRENWLLIKARDAEAGEDGASSGFLEESAVSVKTGRPMEAIVRREKPKRETEKRPASRNAAKKLQALERKYTSVQLATLVDEPPEGDEWLHEIKFDGYRLLGFLAGGAVSLRTRNGLDWTNRFPPIRSAMEKLTASSAVLDMEAVVLDESGKSSFQGLQEALGGGGDTSRIVALTFDLLHLEGKDLTRLPLTERKRKLEALLKDAGGALRYSEHIQGKGREMLDHACGLGLEGIVSKLADAPYEAGRGKRWLKSKCASRQEFIILGYRAARSGERALGAVYLGYRKNGDLRYAGKVGTGFTMKNARALVERFKPLTVEKPVLSRAAMGDFPAAEYHSIHWIKPELLCEVAFTEWTADGHIRHPSFQGLREDKPAGEVKMEQPVAVRAGQRNAGESAPTSRDEKTKAGARVIHGIRITHPDRVISEAGQVTKGELAEYHAAVAHYLLPGIARHPVSLVRCPNGIGRPCFYQRRLTQQKSGRGLGGEVLPFRFTHKGRGIEYLYVESEAGLLSLIQMGVVEIHPWGASVDEIDYPDRMVIDLDPAPDVAFNAVKLAAQDLRQRLQEKGLEAALKCTGGKGMHVMVPLAGKDKWPQVKAFAAALAHEMVEAAPRAYVATMTKAERAGKIFIDYFRNDCTATAIADYSVRARPGMPVALPLEWKELKHVQSASQFTMKEVLERLEKHGAVSGPKAQRLP